MARRRRTGFLDEGSDSGDPSSEGEERESSPPPGRLARRAPGFVAASRDTATHEQEAMAEDEVGDGAAAPMDEEEEPPVRAGLGGGLGALGGAGAQLPTSFGAPRDASPARPSGAGGGFDPSAYLRQMGWTGGGLGKEGQGIVNPIEVQQRPNRAGVAFGGRREKSTQERQEERRRTGAPLSDDEAPAARKRPQRAAWRRREREAKPRIVHRTYEEILAAEAGQGPDAALPAEGPVIDATRREMRQVDSLAAALAQAPVPTSESTQLPELRHNLRLLRDSNHETLHKLAVEGGALLDRARWLQRDADESRRRLNHEKQEHARLRAVLASVQALAEAAPIAAAIDELTPHVDALLQAHGEELAALQLDEAVAGAMVPAWRRELAVWEPLTKPHAFTVTLARWRPVLRTGADSRVMTPFESVLWNLWMPPVRNALTNTWDVGDPAPAIALVEAWRELLPRFILDNVLDQLVLPKVHRAVHNWTPHEARVPLYMLVLPWLPLAEARMHDVLADARRQWRSVLSAWRPSQGVPAELEQWAGVFPAADWEALLLDRVVPKLGAALRTEFRVNPAAQEMRVLEQVLAWRGVLRDSVLSRLLETEFVPPWLRVLHQWLMQPDADLAEVADWYAFWRSWLAPVATQLPGLSHAFGHALQLMNAALELGATRCTALPPVSFQPHPRSAEADGARTKAQSAPGAAAPPTLEDVTFRSIVEERAALRDLFVLSLNRLEPGTGLPLLRLAPHIDGKRGVTFYIDDDVLFVWEAHGGQQGEYVPLALAEVLERGARM